MIYFIAKKGGGFLAAFVHRKNIICVKKIKIKQMTSGGGGTNSASDGIRQSLISFFLRLLPLSRTLTSNGANDLSHTFLRDAAASATVGKE